MKIVNRFIYLGALTMLLINGSCQKESLRDENSFVCLVETESNYATRSCFQLTDGSYVIVGIGEEDYPVMARFSDQGDLIWQKKLPGTLAGVRKGIPLPSGGFVLAGSDSTWGTNSVAQSGKTTITVYDINGSETHSVVINCIPNINVENHLDFILLKNGNLAFCLSPAPAIGSFCFPRLLILSQNLSTLFDQVYYESPGIPFKQMAEPFIQEGIDGSIYFCYQYEYFSPCEVPVLLKLNPDYSFNFLKDSIGNCTELPSSLAIDGTGNCLIATAKAVRTVSYFNREDISAGYEVSVIRTDTAGNFLDRHDYNGFNGLGSLMKILRTRDGGFIMVGTSNQSERSAGVANTQVLLMKTDANLNKLWMKQLNTTYAAVGYDVFETRDGGYAVGVFERSFNKNFKMMIIKTDEKGN